MMNTIPMYEYLGKNSNEISGVEFQDKIDDIKIGGSAYHHVKKIKNLEYGSDYLAITFNTSSDNVVVSISVHIKGGAFPKELYQKMCSVYGEPSQILELDKLTSSESAPEESTGRGVDGISVQFFSSSTKECRFDENPAIIIWQKSNYKIECNIDLPYPEVGDQIKYTTIRYSLD